MIRTN